MDGVDKFDQLLSYYRIHIKSKKLTLRLIFHAFDFACVNIWLEYKTIIKNKHVTKKYVLDMLHFKLKIADALIILNQSVHRPCGRPSSANSPRNSPISVPKRMPCETRPLREIQSHFAEYDEHEEDTRKKLGCK